MRRITVRPARQRQARLDQPPVDVFPPRPLTRPEIFSGVYQNYQGLWWGYNTAPGLTLKVYPGTWDETDGPVTVTGRWLMRLNSNWLQIGEDNQLELLITPEMGTGPIRYEEVAERDGVIVYQGAQLVPIIEEASPAPQWWRATTPISGDRTVGGTITKPVYEWAYKQGIGELTTTGEWYRNGQPTGVTTDTFTDGQEGDVIFWIETATLNGVSAEGPPLIKTSSDPTSNSTLAIYVSDLVESARADMRTQALTRIDGLAGGAANMNIMQTTDPTRKIYAWNENMWAYDLRYQLSANRIYYARNSYVSNTGGDHGWVLITPRHILSCAHIGKNPVGYKYRFVTHDNRVVDAVNIAVIGTGRNQDYGPSAISDMQVALLDRNMDAEGFPYLPIFSESLAGFRALTRTDGDPVPLLGVGQSRLLNGTPPGPYSDYPLLHERMLYIKSTGFTGATGSPEFGAFNYGLYSGDSGTPGLILVNGQFFVTGVLINAPYGVIRVGTTNDTISAVGLSTKDLLLDMIAKCDQRAIAAGKLEAPTGLVPDFVGLDGLMSYPSPSPAVISTTPYRGWFIGGRIQTDPTKATVNVRTERVFPSEENLVARWNYQRQPGTILEGPLYNPDNETWWYRISFDIGVTGWVGADNLQNETPNAAPFAESQTVTTDEDTAIEITLAASDPDNDPLTYTITLAPAKGTLSGTAPNLTYTPNAGETGWDQFQFTASDGVKTSLAATVNINIVAAPVPPPTLTANAQSVTLDQDTSAQIALTGSHSAGASLIYQIVSWPAQGQLTGTGANRTYTPTPGYFGSDSFTFRVTDGIHSSATATVSITVNEVVAPPVNTPPVANPQTLSTEENIAVSITLTGSDVDGDSLTYEVLTQPSHGTLDGTAPNLTYTPGTGYSGIDSFTFRVSDGLENSAAATINIEVTESPVEPPPVDDRVILPMARTGWTVTVSSELGSSYVKARAVDGNTGTFWHSKRETVSPSELPHWLAVDLGSTQSVKGFRFAPRLPENDTSAQARLNEWKLYLSSNGVNWGTPVAEGSFPNNTEVKEFQLDVDVPARHLKVEMVSAYGEPPPYAWAVAEFYVLTMQEPYVEPPQPPDPPPVDPPPPGETIETNSLTKDGVTWTFSQLRTCGQYANGDWWVLGPVTITNITPTPITGRNGTVVNPARGRTQGFDDRAYSGSYNDALNVGKNLPLAVPANSSVVSSISGAATVNFVTIEVFVVLTVVDAVPAPGSFRPPYIGDGSRASLWTTANINYNALKSLNSAALTSKPNITTVAGYFEKTWYEQDLTWTGRLLHTSYMASNGYGKIMAIRTGDAALLLNLDYTNAQKAPLLTSLVQYGIDIYGIRARGGRWYDTGGHNIGRLAPLLVTAAVLDSSEIKSQLAGSLMGFSEHCQTFFVSQEDVDRTRYTADGKTRLPYTSSDIGMPEWGETHNDNPSRDGNNWNVAYRDICGGQLTAPAMAARVMGLRSVVNWEAMFQYQVRHLNYEQSAGYGGEFNSNPTPWFHRQFYNLYSNQF
jgi:hypothetical protein